jgi:hypothetical protein
LFVSSNDATTAKNKKQDLFNNLNKIFCNQIMTFVVRLHYADYLMHHLYGAKSKFDFKTYPVLPRVFDEIESEMEAAWGRRIVSSSKSASTEFNNAAASSPGGQEMAASSPGGQVMVADRLSTVVDNLSTALREFEKFVRDSMKS